MSTGVKVPWDVGQAVATRLCESLSPHCARLEIAGSLRRGKPEVGDIELVAIPLVEEQVQRDLFGEVVERTAVNRLALALDTLVASGAIAADPPSPDLKRAWGEKYRKFWLLINDRWGAIQVDLFLTTPEAWGAIFTIRTGPAEFSEALVTHFKYHTPYRQQGGVLVRQDTGAVVPVPEEADYFRLAGLPFITPVRRSAEALHQAAALQAVDKTAHRWE